MANLNRIILVGRLAADPDMRTTVEGTSVTKFCLAVDREPKRAGSQDFIDCVAWRGLAETGAQYLKKGQLVLVEGRIQVRSFESGEGGRRWVTEVVLRNLQPLEKGRADSAGNEKPADDFRDVPADPLGADLPF